jgi:hypothetical protein
MGMLKFMVDDESCSPERIITGSCEILISALESRNIKHSRCQDSHIVKDNMVSPPNSYGNMYTRLVTVERMGLPCQIDGCFFDSEPLE